MPRLVCRQRTVLFQFFNRAKPNTICTRSYMMRFRNLFLDSVLATLIPYGLQLVLGLNNVSKTYVHRDVISNE